MYVPNRVSSLRRDVKLSRASNFYTLGSFNPEEEWDITTFKNYPISGYLQVKGKLKWFALQGDRLCWFKEKGDTNRKGFWLLSTLQRIRYSFEIDSTEENVGIVVSLVDSSGRTSEVYLGMPSNEIDDARHWYDVLSWACFGFLKSDTEEGSAPKEITAPRPFSGWLKRKTANGWKSRHFLALAHQVKWYNTEQTSRENLMGFLSMFSITGIFDGLVKGKLHPCLLEMEIQKSKTDCVFFIERSFSKEPLYLLAPSKQVKLIWLDVLTRLHKYFSSLPGSYEEPMSDIDNDDAKEVLAVERAKLESLMSFVPMIVIKRFLADPTVLVEPESERLPNSAVLFADISGFTTLAERLAKKGEAEGAEILCKHLNAYFGKLVEIIHKNGGDVIKYAGDALLALWYNGPAWLTAMCATQCGLDMQTHTAKYSADSVTLTLHIGVASGAVTGLHLGGVRMRWEYLIGGQPMLEIAHAEAAAKSGDVVLTGRTWGLVSEHCKGRMINGEPALWLLEEISIKFKPPANPPVDPDLSIQASLRSYIPETIRKRIDIGLSDWMAELRRVTVMFVQLTNLTFTGRDEETDKLQHSFTHMQSAIYDYSGIIRQFIIDDKGSVLVAAFFQHEDDPVRALKAGINIISRLKNINVNSSIGVTTGKVFLGAVGSSIRHEFAMVGDTVNLAARLMVVANKFVICDNYTFQAANAYPGTLLKFLSLNSIRVKGKSTLIPIFKASLEASGDVLVCPSLGDNREEAAIVGREEECDLLLKFIEDGLSGKKIVFVEGEEGIGKSLFLSHVRERIANQGCTIANIKGDSANSMTPLHAWRRFTLERIFKFAKPVAENSTEELRAAVLESLSKINSVDAAPLLNDSFMLSFPDTRPGLEPNAKLAETVSLFTKLIAKEVSDAQKFVVFIDDGDLVDRWSYEVLTLLSKVFISLVIIISRGLTSTIPSETKSLIETSEVFHLRLSPLTSESTREIILQVLQAKSIPNAVVALIHERSSGNPYFTVLLATSLLESNAVKVLPHGECEFSKKLKNVEDIALPDTLENLITSRIGRLSSKDQFVLKVASVVGMQFEFRLLTMIYPVPEDKGSLAQSIEALQAMNFIEPIPYEKEPTFQFTQTAVRDCCYNLLLFEQRRLLHVSVAEWYKEFNDDSKPYDHLLGYHYECAGDLSNSSLHYKLAADEALAQYSLKKAANFYITAFKNFKNVQSANQSGFYAQLLNGLAECFYRLGQYKKAYFYFESALKYLGQPLPRMKTGSSIKDVFRWKSSTKGDDALCLEAVRCYENLSVIFYAVGDKSKMVNCVHQALSLSTVLDSKAELARIHVLLSLSSKVSGDETTADKQLKRAQELVSCVPHALTFANVLFYATLKDALNGIPSPTDFKSVLEMYSRAFEWTKWCEATQLLSMCSLWAGDFGESLEAGKRLLECGVKYDDVVTSITGHLVQARAHLGRTEYSAALQWLMEASRIFESEENLTFHTSLHLETMGLLACAYFRSSDFARTVEVVHDILHMELLEVHFHLYLMYCELIVICLALWLAPQCEALTSKCSVDIKGLLLRLYNALSHMAKAFPVCAPRALMRKGQVDWVLGNAKKAKRNLEEALSLAEKLPSGMKYEMAFCQFEVGFLLEDELVREAVFKKGAEQLAELKVPFPPSLISN